MLVPINMANTNIAEEQGQFTGRLPEGEKFLLLRVNFETYWYTT